jgi:hypothetical protein
VGCKSQKKKKKKKKKKLFYDLDSVIVTEL